MVEAGELLDIKQAAALLQVSETSLRRWSNQGRLPCYRVGRRRERRFRRVDLLAFLEGGPGSPASLGDIPVPSGRQVLIGGIPAPLGTHLCGFHEDDENRVGQAVQFLAEGLREGSACLLVAREKAREEILDELGRQHPELAGEREAGRFVATEYLSSGARQLEYFRRALAGALRSDATGFRVLGDLSDGGPERRTFARLLEYEQSYDRQVARRFPVVTLCQYDAGRLSGRQMLAVLRAHHHTLRYPGESLGG
jgi:transcriptional repressor of dcmA and dcmR